MAQVVCEHSTALFWFGIAVGAVFGVSVGALMIAAFTSGKTADLQAQLDDYEQRAAENEPNHVLDHWASTRGVVPEKPWSRIP